jgi:hypothetical protein
LADVAVSGLYTGLKFTGLALKVATGLAQVITKDAEKAFATKETTTPQVPIPIFCWSRCGGSKQRKPQGTSEIALRWHFHFVHAWF